MSYRVYEEPYDYEDDGCVLKVVNQTFINRQSRKRFTTKSDMNVLLNPPTTTKAITPVGNSIVAALMSIPVRADIDALPPSRRIAETIREVNKA